MRRFFLVCGRMFYRWIIRPVLFQFDSESVHTTFLSVGEWLGNLKPITAVFELIMRPRRASVDATVAGIPFRSPVGLAAGFDYEGRLPQILSALGFGFETVGTVTKIPFEGNARPRLGRLVRSQALVVNKGFKNPGTDVVLERLSHVSGAFPIGLSIGRTNTPEYTTHAEAIGDIVSSFERAEHSPAPVAYYELNISCPNLATPIDFYEPRRLAELLSAVTNLRLSRPLFVKMPISVSNEEMIAMLDVVVSFPVTGVVLGNLQKDRSHPTVVAHESAAYPRGNLSGLPCRDRSDELIQIAYRHVGKRLSIVGCGGIFSTEDAYRKIRLGASLVQLITGLVFEGPLLAAEVADGIGRAMSRDGFHTLDEVIGVDARTDA